MVILDVEDIPKNEYLPIIKSEQTWFGISGGQNSPPFTFQFTYSRDSIFIGANNYFERIQSIFEDGSDPFIQGHYREIEGKIFRPWRWFR